MRTCWFHFYFQGEIGNVIGGNAAEIKVTVCFMVLSVQNMYLPLLPTGWNVEGVVYNVKRLNNFIIYSFAETQHWLQRQVGRRFYGGPTLREQNQVRSENSVCGEWVGGVTDWLTDWLSHWLTHWLTDCSIHERNHDLRHYFFFAIRKIYMKVKGAQSRYFELFLNEGNLKLNVY